MERDLNGFKVRQNSKTGMFCANDLLDIYNMSTTKNKRLDSYLRLTNVKSYIRAVIEDMNSNTTDVWYLEKDVIQAKKGKVNGGTWMHPYVFIDFAMWLSPEFKLNCIKWIYDNLLKFRNDSGNSFKEVNSALREAGATDPLHYIREAKMINKLALGASCGGQRNSATEGQLDLLNRLQKADVKLINKRLTFPNRVKELQNLKLLLT